MKKIKLAELRRAYTKNGLDEAELPDEPGALFMEWVDQALEASGAEANTMALGTRGRDGHPDVRIVLLKGVSEGGISFFTNYNSEKARQIDEHPWVSCCLWWPELERQVRISGAVKKVGEKESSEYFASRPRDSQIGAWVSDQSSAVKDRAELEKRAKLFGEKFAGGDVPKPGHWGGYEVSFEKIEFWQGRPGRLHDRILYVKRGEDWTRSRLAP